MNEQSGFCNSEGPPCIRPSKYCIPSLNVVKLKVRPVPQISISTSSVLSITSTLLDPSLSQPPHAGCACPPGTLCLPSAARPTDKGVCGKCDFRNSRIASFPISPMSLLLSLFFRHLTAFPMVFAVVYLESTDLFA